MSTCAVAVQQADGSYLLQVDPTVTDVSSCTYVVQSGADIAGSLLLMSANDGATYSLAIFSVWVTAWAFRMFVRTLNGDQNDSE
ncbi:hypothetical protein HNR39_000762 [Glaciimonas immobilis]|uniref:Uncharacterized protein n=1 Tax=Glaciimonas immobilis TaxID=728004 RepID=A0A840RPA2_9BURK|nr:hypothetical protein [Glaciimonas immobilis]